MVAMVIESITVSALYVEPDVDGFFEAPPVYFPPSRSLTG